MSTLGSFRVISLGTLLLSFVMQVALAQERFTREINFDIAAQSIEAALLEFSKQADVQVMVGGALNGQKTEGVRGKFSVTDGLNQLLKNTGLEYRAEGNTITIRSIKNARADAQVPQFVDGVRLASSDAPEEAATQDELRHDPQRMIQMLDEVIVTGTHIRGRDNDGTVLAFSQQDLAETGYTTVQDWLKTLPQNFSGGQNEQSSGVGNFNRGTGINLRGLGTGATLVLVNGRRQPASGLQADFVDISSIPTSAIERVEVLTDGASAIYGSDAIGGVVNLVLRKDFNGAETSARYAVADGGVDEKLVSQLFGLSWDTGHAMLDYQYYERSALGYADRDFSASADKRRFGGSDFRSFLSNPGNLIVGGRPAFAIPPGQDGSSLEPSDLLAGVVNLQEPQKGASLMPERESHAAFLSLSQEITSNISLFLDARYGKRDASADFPAQARALFVPASNPFFVSPNGAPFAFVGYSFYDDLGTGLAQGTTETYVGSFGADIEHSSTWRSTWSVSKGRETLDFTLDSMNNAALSAALADPNPATALNPFGAGSHTNPETLARLRSLQIEKGASIVEDANVIADGSLLHLPGGDIKLAFGADYRREEIERGLVQTHFDRTVKAGFAELVVPIVGRDNARAGIQSLELSAAGRYEDYSDFGSTFNPKVSLRYSPVDALRIRGSWGTSFRAPLLVDLDTRSRPPNFTTLDFVFDPTTPGGLVEAILRNGGNANLSEETADTWTVGLDIQPSNRFRASLTYFDIAYQDRVATPGPLDTLTILFDESRWSTFINHNPTPEQRAEVCNDPSFVGSVQACLASSAIIVDLRKSNLAETNVRGLDLTLQQAFSTDVGEFAVQLNGSYLLAYEIAATASDASIDVRDTVNNPNSVRLRATGSWIFRDLGVNLSLNHMGAYDDIVGTRRSVDAWNTVDLQVTYSALARTGWMQGLTIALSAANLLNEDPPFVNSTAGYDPTNATALNRLVALQLTKVW